MDSEGGPLGLRSYVAALRRRRRLILAAVGAALALSVFALSLQTPTYKSSVQLAVPPVAERSELERIVFGSADLGTQQQLMTSASVIEFALEERDLPASPAAVEQFARSRVKVKAVPATSVLELTVSDTDPERAAGLAGSLVEGYIAVVERDAQARATKANAELDVLSKAARAELVSIEQQLAQGAGSTQSSLELRRDELQAQLREAASRRAELQSAIGLVRRVDVIQPPVVPTSPASPRWLLGIAVAVVVGLALGVVLALLRDGLDETLGREPDVMRAGAAPLLASIPAGKQREPAVVHDPDGPVADAYRSLRTFLLACRTADALPSGGRVTAVLPVDGGSDVAHVGLDLALTLASSGRRVVLIDGDLRRCTTSALLTPGSPQGLAQLLTRPLPTAELLHQPYPDVSFLGAGSTSRRAREQLSGRRLTVVLDELRGVADEVVVVSVALDLGSEALDLATRADDVLLVAHPGRTRASDLQRAAERLQAVGGRLVGTVFAAPAPRRWLNVSRSAAPGSAAGSAPERTPALSRAVPPSDSQ